MRKSNMLFHYASCPRRDGQCARAINRPGYQLPNEIEFQAPLRPGSPPAVVLYGDMTKQGLYVYRVKFPAGFKVMPHWHGEERHIRRPVGYLHMGIGESWDETKLKAYRREAFYPSRRSCLTSPGRKTAKLSFKSPASAQRQHIDPSSVGWATRGQGIRIETGQHHTERRR